MRRLAARAGPPVRKHCLARRRATDAANSPLVQPPSPFSPLRVNSRQLQLRFRLSWVGQLRMQARRARPRFASGALLKIWHSDSLRGIRALVAMRHAPELVSVFAPHGPRRRWLVARKGYPMPTWSQPLADLRFYARYCCAGDWHWRLLVFRQIFECAGGVPHRDFEWTRLRFGYLLSANDLIYAFRTLLAPARPGRPGDDISGDEYDSNDISDDDELTNGRLDDGVWLSRQFPWRPHDHRELGFRGTPKRAPLRVWRVVRLMRLRPAAELRRAREMLAAERRAAGGAPLFGDYAFLGEVLRYAERYAERLSERRHSERR